MKHGSLRAFPTPPCRMVFITLITLPDRTFSLCGTIISERGKEAGSYARLGFNAKSNTLDTIKFALGEDSVFMIDGKQM